MSNIAIRVDELSKIYRLGEIGTGTISRDMERWFKTKVLKQEDPFLKIGETNDRANKGSSDIVYSLQDINFEIQQGDAVGIIGRNGAGKSTLLKILSRVTTPTTGRINIKGRVASLLEVGTGFHPELTGRENIYLNGAILGMRKREIDRKLDEIIDFSGVERYIDTPVKRYSSGMYVRLAFAVAAHLESEILIVDEVLAVGDAEFQKKCLGKMGEVSKGEGRTVLFVSHNMASLSSICSQGLMFVDGKLHKLGSMKFLINEYEKYFMDDLNSEWINPYDHDAENRLKSIKIYDINGIIRDSFLNSECVIIEFNIEIKEYIDNVKIGFELLKNQEILFRAQQVDINSSSTFYKGNYTITGKIPKNLLNEGVYYIRPLFSVHNVRSLMTIYEEVVSFKVQIDTSISVYHSNLNADTHPGIIFPSLHWEISKY